MADAIDKVKYLAAKARYESWTEKQHKNPTPAMLADVELINKYEQAEDEVLAKLDKVKKGVLNDITKEET